MATNRILVIEDEPLLGLDVCEALKGYGYEVRGPVDSGEEAINQAASYQPNLILMDINLKGKVDGIEAANAIFKRQAVPLIFLTADTDETTLQRAKLPHSYGYLIKPFDPSELHSTIELTLHRFERDRASSKPVEFDSASRDEFEDQIAGDEQDKAAILRKLRHFSDLSPDSLQALADECSIRQLDGGAVIVAEGEDARGGFVPLSGRVSVTRSSQAGKDLIVALLGPGDLFGLFYLIDSFSRSSWARTQTASRVLWIPHGAFQRFCNSEPKIFPILAGELARRLIHSYELATGLAHERVEGRIVTMLTALLRDFGKSTSNPKEGRIFITRRELADLTGTTPETAIRVTKNLERDGLLDLSRAGIIKILDVNALRGYTV